MRRARLVPTLLLSVVALGGAGACVDHAKESEDHAVKWIAAVEKRATSDIDEMKVGLPLGAKQFTPIYAHGATANDDLAGVRNTLLRVRGVIPELTRSSSTFFALTDANGLAIRNDLEQDVMAGQDAWKLFPELKDTKNGRIVATGGLFAGGRPSEPDRDWVIAAPVNDEAGKFVGTLMGGWTYRRFAYHLQETLRHDLTELQLKTGDNGKLPIVYVSVFDKTGVYSAPFTPPVNQQALVDLGLVAKTAAGAAAAAPHGHLNITDRDFGWAAVRVPSFVPEGGVVLLWSEI
jgi:hypothetical protein